MARPRIGITTSYNNGNQSISHYYIDAIEAAGGLPLIVPMCQTGEAMQDFARLLDGLVITGGPGITRGLIGMLPDDLPAVDPVRDRADMLAFEAIQDKPVLGICYGMQFINAMAGGQIYADIVDHVDNALIHSQERGGQDHPVYFEQNSMMYDIFGDEIVVNTYHKQAVASVGSGLRAVGHGPDGVIEAIESVDGRMVGVQFHPERMLDRTRILFEDFVRRCRGV